MLLAGTPELAQAAVLETFADAGEKIHHFRNGKSCKAWLVAKLRNRLLKNPGQPTGDPAEKTANASASAPELNPGILDLADTFYKIPEPGRSALALLYLDQFSPLEIAQILLISMEEMAVAVDSARTLLQQMEAVKRSPSATDGQAL